MPSIFGSMVVKNGIKQVIYNFSNARKKTYAQVQAMSDAEKQGVIICDDYPATEGYVHYTATEQKIGTWIDGRDLYEKTIDCGGLPNNTYKTVNHGITYREIISFSGTAYRAGEANLTSITLPCTNPYAIGLTMRLSDLLISVSGDASSMTQSYVTIRYTKPD